MEPPFDPDDTLDMPIQKFRGLVMDQFVSIDARFDAQEKRFDAQEKRFDAQDKTMAEGNKIMSMLVEQTAEVRRVVEGTRWTARAAKAIGRAIVVTIGWLARTLHTAIKWLTPIVVFIVTVWGLIYAYLHNGKPPS